MWKETVDRLKGEDEEFLDKQSDEANGGGKKGRSERGEGDGTGGKAGAGEEGAGRVRGSG